MTVAASISGQKECWNSSLDGRLEVVGANIQLEAMAVSIQLQVKVAVTSEAARLWETLPTTSRVLDSYENPIT
jgi:hypothetical protein